MKLSDSEIKRVLNLPELEIKQVLQNTQVTPKIVKEKNDRIINRKTISAYDKLKENHERRQKLLQ
jgi:hypothetical protein